MASVVRKKSHSISDGSQYSSQPSGESVDDIKVDDNFFVVHTAGKESNMVVVKNPVPFFPATIEDDLEITSARNSVLIEEDEPGDLILPPAAASFYRPTRRPSDVYSIGRASLDLAEEYLPAQVQNDKSSLSTFRESVKPRFQYDYIACFTDAIRGIVVNLFRIGQGIGQRIASASRSPLRALSSRAVTEVEAIDGSTDDEMGNGSSIMVAQTVEEARKTGVLVLSNHDLAAIPGIAFSACNDVRLLDLSANRIHSLPDSLARFRFLRSLFLNQNRLATLPEAVGQLTLLQFLSVSYNFLERLPRSVDKLVNLRECKLCRNRIRVFPQELIFLPNLKVLDLSRNLLEELPSGTSNMKLTDLNLNENRIVYMSDDVPLMKTLQILRLQNNKLNLNAIPDNIFSDSDICQLLLENNLFEMEALREFEGYDLYMARNTKLRRSSVISLAGITQGIVAINRKVS